MVSLNLDEQVKQLMMSIESDDKLADISNLFFDLLENHDLNLIGKPTKNSLVEDSIAVISRTLIKNAVVSNFISTYTKRYRLWYGTYFVNAHFSSYFYFQVLDIGMITVSNRGYYTDFARFTMNINNPIIH